MSDETWATQRTRRELLTRGVVGAENARLYMTSAWFKANVDGIVAFLPTVIDGLAAIAERKGKDLSAQLLAALQGFGGGRDVAP